MARLTIVTNKMKNIENKLKNKIKKGIYENFGQPELQEFKEWLDSTSLPQHLRWDYYNRLSVTIENIQEYKAE